MPPDESRIQELDLRQLNTTGRDERLDDKANTLSLIRRQGVRRMTHVYCNHDAAWSLDVLRGAAATLEELDLWYPRAEHLGVVHAMPRLRRLRLCHDDTLAKQYPGALPALPQPSSLQWLGLNGLPRGTVESLLRAHGAALDELWLLVGTPGGAEWPKECRDLHGLLGRCGVRAARLVLRRYWVSHEKAACRKQLDAVRRALPATLVQCSMCDKVPLEDV
ncbi:uncharacterized protein LOC117641103 [Thrips palmi]|uniref:Uncharacterized protein LOC117641103 n=1 Tax=Thrips palmi TaxID=161013 RepID=A0A6P8YCP4_THRPL|nr:uncharacterized protein LOC117641103 [Thrips palmi]